MLNKSMLNVHNTKIKTISKMSLVFDVDGKQQRVLDKENTLCLR